MTRLSLLLTLLATALAPAGAAVDHAPFDALLRQHVQNGLVDYPAFQNNRAFGGYLQALASASTDGMATDERLALYLNAYNAFVIESVNKHWPVDQVVKIRGFLDTEKHKLAGKEVTLDDLENSLIRPLGDARVHAAVVGGAKGGPALRSEAYAADKLNRQLDEQVAKWVNDPAKNRVDKGHKTLLVSMIFKWYKEDFEASGGPAGFLKKYLRDDGDQRWLASGDYQIDYLKYDWDLNSQ